MDIDEEGLLFDVTEKSFNPELMSNFRELIIFVIDCSESMFRSSENGEIPFRTSILCCRSVIMHKIIGSSSDYIGIVLYGTREKNEGDQYPKHVVTLLSPKQPNADIVKLLDSMLKSENFNDFDTKYGHSDNYSLSDVLWHCTSLIGQCSAKFGVKKLSLLTCVQHPHRESSIKQHHVRKKAEDLQNLDIQLEVLTLKDSFDGNLFYNEIIKIVNGPDAEIESGETIIKELVDGHYRKDCKKRSLAQLEWMLSDDVSVGVELYCFYRSLTVPSIRKLCRKTNENLRSITQTYNAETGERLLKSDLNKKIEIGEQTVALSVEEHENLRLQVKPGIRLLGFKSISFLDPEIHVQKSSFIYPSERAIKKSTRAFVALLDRCSKRDKFALCYLLARARGKPSLVALVPQQEIRDGVQLMPPGFHIIYLPYAENIREIEILPSIDLNEEEVNLCRKIAKKILIKYRASNFENPKVQTHWAIIEALALNYPDKREVIDSTLPNYDFVSENRLKDLETRFLNTFYINGYDPEVEAVKKRKYPAYSENKYRYPNAKLPKFDPTDTDYVKNMMTHGYGDKLTVPVLKNFLVEKGVFNIKNFKKADLLCAVKQELNIDD